MGGRRGLVSNWTGVQKKVSGIGSNVLFLYLQASLVSGKFTELHTCDPHAFSVFLLYLI